MLELSGFSIFVLVVVVLAVVLLFLGIKVISQGNEATVERFGRYTRTLRPGLNLVVPFADRIGVRLNMMEQVLDVPNQEVITRDNAMVSVDGVVFFQVLDATRAAYEVRDLTRAMLNLCLTNIRTVMGSLDLDALLSQRDVINQRLLSVIDEATTPWGVKVTRVEIRDITPPRDLVDAMARQMKAEREKRAAILEAEGLREAEILRAEGDKQAVVLAAEGQREAAFREAEARERLAEAEARATAMVSEAIAKGDVTAINYFIAEKYVDALKQIASADNQRLVLMPLEASSVIGAVGGIGEIVRQAFNPPATGAAGSGDGAPAAPVPTRPANVSSPSLWHSGSVPATGSGP
jgi:regulator of protease activity HflC (stomatin/prohibitin superfamily)